MKKIHITHKPATKSSFRAEARRLCPIAIKPRIKLRLSEDGSMMIDTITSSELADVAVRSFGFCICITGDEWQLTVLYSPQLYVTGNKIHYTVALTTIDAATKVMSGEASGSNLSPIDWAIFQLTNEAGWIWPINEPSDFQP